MHGRQPGKDDFFAGMMRDAGIVVHVTDGIGEQLERLKIAGTLQCFRLEADQQQHALDIAMLIAQGLDYFRTQHTCHPLNAPRQINSHGCKEIDLDQSAARFQGSRT